MEEVIFIGTIHWHTPLAFFVHIWEFKVDFFPFNAALEGEPEINGIRDWFGQGRDTGAPKLAGLVPKRGEIEHPALFVTFMNKGLSHAEAPNNYQ